MLTYREVFGKLNPIIEEKTVGTAKGAKEVEVGLRGIKAKLREKIGLPRYANPERAKEEMATGFGKLDTEIPQTELDQVRTECRSIGVEI